MLLLFAAAFSSGAANISFTFLASLSKHLRVSNHSTFAPLTLSTFDSIPDEAVLLLS